MPPIGQPFATIGYAPVLATPAPGPVVRIGALGPSRFPSPSRTRSSLAPQLGHRVNRYGWYGPLGTPQPHCGIG